MGTKRGGHGVLEQMSSQDGAVFSNVTAIAGGDRHTVALRGDRTVWACGLNNKGQLGNGNFSIEAMQTEKSPVQVRLRDGAPLSGVIAIAAGKDYTVAIGGEAEESMGVSE